MAVQTPRKPKRVVETSEALQPSVKQAPFQQALNHDPVLRDLLQTASPECAPVPAHILQKQVEDNKRRERSAQIASETNGQNGKWAFVKNQNTKEPIVFKDGSKFQFKDSLLLIEDEELAKKILEVADIYNIVLK